VTMQEAMDMGERLRREGYQARMAYSDARGWVVEVTGVSEAK
jgi:hypothetical protein